MQRSSGSTCSTRRRGSSAGNGVRPCPGGRGAGGAAGAGDRLGLLRLHPAGELEQQLRGIEVLGAAAVEVAAEQGELMRELVDELLFVAELGEQLRAVLPEILGIVGSASGVAAITAIDAARGDRFRPSTIAALSDLTVTRSGGR